MKPVVWCALALLASIGGHAEACSILPSEPKPPVTGRFNYPSSDPTYPIHLPANAKGVIFLTTEAMRDADFSMTKSGSRHRLPVKVIPLPALKPDPMPMAIPSGWEHVTALRVGPKDGFSAGSAYTIKTRWDSVDVVIDYRSVDVNQKIGVVKVGTRNREKVLDLSFCNLTPPVVHLVDYQPFEYRVPSGLAAYQNRIFAFGLLPIPADASYSPYSDKRPYVRDYLSAIERAPVGPGLRNDVEALSVSSERAVPEHDRRVAHYGFFEVDDAWHETDVIDFAPRLATISHLDSLDFLEAALRSNDIGKLKSQLEALPVRDTSRPPALMRRYDRERQNPASNTWIHRIPDYLDDWRYQRRFQGLMDALTKLMRHPDPAIRVAAIGALGRVIYQAEPDAVTIRSATSALGVAMTENNEAVKAAVRDSLALMSAPHD